MAKKLTNRLLGIIAMMFLMMTTSLSARAGYYLAGTFSDWGTNKVEMQQDSEGRWYVTQTVESGQEFKIVDESNNWYGADYNVTDWVIENVPDISLSTTGDNISISTSGTFKFVLDASGNQMVLKIGKEYPVTVKSGLTNGTVTVNKSSAIAGETVNIVVTPADGYYALKSGVKVEKTIDGGSAQAPGLKDNPGVGSYVDLDAGDEVDDVSIARTYSFTMPSYPYGAQVSAEFLQRISIADAVVSEIGDQVYTGSEITPAFTVTLDGTQLTPNSEYTVAYANNTEVGQATITITGKGMYTGEVVKNFNIVKDKYAITITTDDNGTVTASTNAAEEGEGVTLTITPNAGYELATLTVGGETVTATQNSDGTYTYTFTMPDAAVAVNATFSLIPKFFIAGSFTDPAWEDGKLEMTKNADGSFSITVNGITNGTEFKFIDENGAWYGGNSEDNYGIHKGWYSNIAMVTPGSNFVLNIEGESATLTFTVDADKKLTVTGWDYNVTVAENIENGTVVASSTVAKAGDEITLTITPATGYELATLTVMAGEQEVTVEDNKFTMPAADVTVTATFTKIPKLYLVGSFNDWATNDENYEFTRTESGNWVLENVELPAGVLFKLYDENANWLGGLTEGVYNISETEVIKNQNIDLVDGGNFSIKVAGTWTFLVGSNRDVMVVTGEWVNPQYDILVEDNENVTVTLEKNKAIEGENVVVTVTPNDGFVVEGVTANAEGYDAIALTANEDGTYTLAMPGHSVTISVSVKVAMQGVAFTNDRRWSTYYNNYNLELPEGIKAYVVNDVINDATDITEIPYIPAGVGVLLYSDDNGENFTANFYDGTTDTYESLLVGSVTEQTITQGYVLYNNTFIRSEAGTVAPYRCYLPIANVAGAPSLLKIGVTDVPTSIKELIASGNVAGIKYVNMNGVTSNEPFNGFNIVVVTLTDGTTKAVKMIK